MPAAIASQSHPAFEIVGGNAAGGLLILCDHAQASIPAEYADLGLSQAQLARHIAYDIGAETVARTLAAELHAPAVMSRFSRLLIDPNRGTDDPTLVMRIADGAIVPGNARIGQAEIDARIARFYEPYDVAIAHTLDAMQAAGAGTVRPNPAVVSMHSFTPSMKGIDRPWHITVIWDFDPRLNRMLLDALQRESDLVVGENEPYQGGYAGDTIDRHCLKRGLAHVLVEIRQDLIDNAPAAEAWGKRLAGILRPLLADPILYEQHHYGAHPVIA
ncbi:MAG: N-formylglutamate amidohydrolase superfamily [Beijerinckiaceae bacterium]|nr:MAG: N-formylglutamate amidohydrolase superfamily [Beijerinckiaceae bacterium]